MKYLFYKLLYRIVGWHRLRSKSNFGYIPDTIEPSFGAELETLQENKNWSLYLPKFEVQRLAWGDTMACVTYSLMNGLETVLKRVYNQTWDFSDRFTAKMSGTTSSGNTMAKVFNSVSVFHGFVSFPFWKNEGTSFADFYKDIPSSVQELALDNKNVFEFGLHWIAQPNHAAISNALKYSPVWVALFAYGPKVDGVYQRIDGVVPNHCVIIYGLDDNGNYLVYDHYIGGEHRVLAADYVIPYAANITVKKRIA